MHRWKKQVKINIVNKLIRHKLYNIVQVWNITYAESKIDFSVPLLSFNMAFKKVHKSQIFHKISYIIHDAQYSTPS